MGRHGLGALTGAILVGMVATYVGSRVRLRLTYPVLADQCLDSDPGAHAGRDAQSRALCSFHDRGLGHIQLVDHGLLRRPHRRSPSDHAHGDRDVLDSRADGVFESAVDEAWLINESD